MSRKKVDTERERTINICLDDMYDDALAIKRELEGLDARDYNADLRQRLGDIILDLAACLADLDAEMQEPGSVCEDATFM